MSFRMIKRTWEEMFPFFIFVPVVRPALSLHIGYIPPVMAERCENLLR